MLPERETTGPEGMRGGPVLLHVSRETMKMERRGHMQGIVKRRTSETDGWCGLRNRGDFLSVWLQGQVGGAHVDQDGEDWVNMFCRIKNVVFGHEVWALQTRVGVG